MAALDQQIETDLRTAMKARDTEVVATLRMALAAIRNARVAAGRQGELTDEETVELLTREAKKRSEASEAFATAGREDAAEKEQRELAILQRYLPRQLDEEELARIVDDAVAATGASSPGDLGKVMSAVMPQVKGRADGKQVNALVRERLT
ncbi:MAG: GatB/YqeY domain-containing protein [Egibacteraceae bacterium]